MDQRNRHLCIVLVWAFLLVPPGAVAQQQNAGGAYPNDARPTEDYRDTREEEEANITIGAPPPAAQQAPQARRPGTIRYAMRPAPAGTTSASRDATRTHIIKKGDTLWDLAHVFLGDPFTWPRIWKRNPQVANPHLIYPGNVLSISDFLGATSSSEADRRQSFEEATAGFLEDTPAAIAAGDRQAGEGESELVSVEPLLRDKIITSQFLRGVPFLWTETDPRGLVYPGDARIDPHADARLFHQFDEVRVDVFGTTDYAVGDTMDVFSSERMVNYRERKANLVRRVARGVVTAASEKTLAVKLYAVWGVVRPGDRLARAEHFRRYEVDGMIDPPAALSARVFQRVEQSGSPYLYQSFIIDRGSTEGVQLGDIFVIRNQHEQAGRAKPAQVACASYVGEDFSTLTIVRVYDTSLQTGDRAEMVKRTRFN